LPYDPTKSLKYEEMVEVSDHMVAVTHYRKIAALIGNNTFIDYEEQHNAIAVTFIPGDNNYPCGVSALLHCFVFSSCHST